MKETGARNNRSFCPLNSAAPHFVAPWFAVCSALCSSVASVSCGGMRRRRRRIISASSLLSRAKRLQVGGLSPLHHLPRNVCTEGSCSHELGLLHRLLVCGWIPRGVAGNVRARRAHRRLHGGRRGPDWSHRGRAARQSAAGGQNIGVNCTAALFHQFLELGPFILEPDFYLKREKNTVRIISTHA